MPGQARALPDFQDSKVMFQSWLPASRGKGPTVLLTTVTTSPRVACWKYQSASSGERLIQPWLTLATPWLGTDQGAPCVKVPLLLMRTASLTAVR